MDRDWRFNGGNIKEFVDFVMKQLDDVGKLRCRKMFGEYYMYVNEKPFVLVCDDTAFVRSKERGDFAIC